MVYDIPTRMNMGRRGRWSALGTRVALAAALIGLLAAAGYAQPLRIAAWNVTNYTGGRITDIQTAVYAEFEGRSMRPDVIACQEFTSQNAVDIFLWALNNAPGSPGDWAAAPFFNGPDTDNAFFYRTGRVEFLGATIISFGGPSPLPPRDTTRYDFRPIGYTGPTATIALYSVHMKAQESGSDDDARRLLEAQRIVADIAPLPAGWHPIMGGDTNIQTAFANEYRALVGPDPLNPTGPLFDPIMSPGAWNNNCFFRFIHTQDPSGSGGMDDRHDQILIGAGLRDGVGLDYLGSLTTPYSTTTWNDPNHSYRAWGNDGTTCNGPIAVAGNTMVGPAIAQALRNIATTSGGHLPVFLDLRLPPKIDAPTSLAFGEVPQGAGGGSVGVTITIANAADTALWTAPAIADLRYTMEASPGFSAPSGPFADPAGGGGQTHTILMDTSTPGLKTGTLTISSDDPDTPVVIVTLSGTVLGAGGCQADWNGDGTVTSSDISAFLTDWLASLGGNTLEADFNGDGTVTSTDISAFLTAWLEDVGHPC